MIEFVERNLEPEGRVVALDRVTVEFYAGRDVAVVDTVPDPSNRVWLIFSRSVKERSPIDNLVKRMEAGRPRLRTKEAHSAAAILVGPESILGERGKRE